jgi:dihydrofolate synthase / folylpolyglutamate synthase
VMKEKTSYQEGIEYLYNLQKYGIKFGLSKTSNLMKAFGNPHRGRKYIHIAGTNGKGSVATFIASILKQAGIKVGVYSSPHLVRFTERFRINDEEISREKAADLIDELKGAVVSDSPPTFFEATTAMAFLYFAREDTDIAIMEVGMGGRLDATNIITPLVSVITNISMEHQFFLGSRLLDIAGEKGGIIKKGVDLVTGATQPSVISLFKSICREKRASMWRVGTDISYRTTKYGFHYKGIKRRFNRLHLGLKGSFQVRNAALALSAIELLEKQGFRISPGHIQEGLKNSFWPGRMQVMAENPTVLLDGAHNPAAIRALAVSIRTGFEYRRLILVIGIMADKEIGQLLRGIVPIADYVIYTRPVYSRAADPEILMAAAAPLEKPGKVEPLLTKAIEKARDIADPEDLIVICGSLFTVGEALTYFDPETYGADDF